jgi:hypothetical protein
MHEEDRAVVQCGAALRCRGSNTLYLCIDHEQTIRARELSLQERFASVTSSFFRAAHGIIIAFDVTNEKTLTSVQRWIQLARENKPDVPLVVLGNKADLADQRKVTPEQAQSVCGELKMSYYEASALTGDGVQTAFNQFVKRMYTERPVKPTGRQAATTSTGNGRLSSTNVTLSPTAPAAGQGKKGMCAL